MQQKWQRPQLIVLGRGKSQENVLEWCKHNAGGNSSGGNDKSCKNKSGDVCSPCQGLTKS